MNEIIAFFISMLPIVELRGGIVYAAAQGVLFKYAFPICLIGNILPIPIILLFSRQIIRLLEHFKLTSGIAKRIYKKARSSKEMIQKYQWLGLLLFVAIPLPGTGAWTGAFIASIFDMPLKKAFIALAFGVLGAGIIMSILSYWLPGLFFTI